MTEELRGLHRLLKALENGKGTNRMCGQDVTERETALVKREIADDEALLAKSQGTRARRHAQ